jgi:hypothetical protein
VTPWRRGFDLPAHVIDLLAGASMNSTTSPWAIAFLFRGLTHFLPDLHCPPHAGIYVKTPRDLREEGTRNGHWVHMYWDTALDVYSRDASFLESHAYFIGIQAEILMEKYPRERLAPQLAKKEVEDWLSHAHEAAKNYMVPNGEPQLNIVKRERNSAYVINGREKCRELIALAAYRLETVLVDFVRRKKNLPLRTERRRNSIMKEDVKIHMAMRELFALCVNRGLIGTLMVYLLLSLTERTSLLQEPTRLRGLVGSIPACSVMVQRGQGV